MHIASSHSNSPTLRKKSKHDQFQINEQQQKIGQMIHAFYDKLKSKINKSLTKYQNRNSILCKEMFQSLSLHPKQELYQTIKLHDIIFNEIQHLNQIASAFIKRIDTLHQKITEEFTAQKQRNQVKKEKEKQKQNCIATLRKVSFKRQKHNLNNRLISLDTINQKILKCEDSNNENGFYFDIEGKKSEILIYNYSKIWFQNKKRDYLFCYGRQNNKNQFYLMNDKLQIITFINNSLITMNGYLNTVQINNFIYIVTDRKIIRMDLLCEDNTICKVYNYKIVGAQSISYEIVLFVVDNDKHYSVLFVDENMNIYRQYDLKLNVSTIQRYFKLVANKQEFIYLITCSFSGAFQLIKLSETTVSPISSDIVVNPQQIIISGKQKIHKQAIFRQANNKFIVFNENGFANVQVDIDQCESIKNCIILGEHLYALSQNGKYMLECHYKSQLI